MKMNRRNLVKLLGISSMLPILAPLDNTKLFAQNSNPEVIKPNRLKKGDKVGIIAPASNASTPEELAKAKEVIEHFGLVPVFGTNLLDGDGYKTRSVRGRLRDLHQMFEDRSINAVFCIRGGYGSASLLDGLNYELIKANPKIFLGYSDITALHIAIFQNTGLVTFHGPVMLSSFGDYTAESFYKTLFIGDKIGVLANPINDKLRNYNSIYTLVGGKTKGRLIGGNLSLISSLMGTPNEINTKNSILFIEDVGEKPYSLHRMMIQLKQSGKLDDANGIIIGKCQDCQPSGSQNSFWDYSEMETYMDIFKDYKKPVFYGLLIGHTREQLTIPIGLGVEMDADKGIINIKESAVK